LFSGTHGHFYFNTVAFNCNASPNQVCGIDCENGQTIEASIVWGNGTNAGTQFAGNCKFLSVVTDTNEVSTASGLVKATPAFVDSQNDFHLDVSSPAKIAINQMSVLDQITSRADGGVSMLPSVDYDGEPRPKNGAWDVGADEAAH
jgi:hypothetical protein